jgi:hypothetical protein
MVTIAMIYLSTHFKETLKSSEKHGVMNDTFLLFFFDMCLPYAFYFIYLNMSLPAGVHGSPNTCVTCVCLTVNTPLPLIYHLFNMLFMHVHVIFYYYLNQ